MSLTTLKPRIQTFDTRRGASVATERIRGSELQRIRERIFLRDQGVCQICGIFALHGEVDHIVPLHLGGQETDRNRQWAHVTCHKAKSDREEKGRG